MPKKTLFTTLGVLLAMVVASVALVFTIGPRVSADSVGILDRAEYFRIDEDGVCWGFSDVGIEYAEMYDQLQVVFPNTLKEIPNQKISLFEPYGDKVVSVVLPESLESIATLAFGKCTALTTINLPSKITSIKSMTFWNCSSLTSIEIPANVESIDDHAFDGCTSLTSIVIPSTVTWVGEYAFASCDNLTKIYCECSEDFAQNNWDEYWRDDYSGLGVLYPVEWNYDSTQQSNNENQNNENGQTQNQEPETPSLINEKNQTGVVAAVAGTAGGAAGLGTIGTIIGVVISKKRKNN